jgi:hypothetical protein
LLLAHGAQKAWEDAGGLLDWFSDTHGLPFEGHIYNWARLASATATA